MSENDWIPLAPGFEIKPCADGQVIGRRRENIGGMIKQNEELRRATKENTKVGNMGETSFLQTRHGIIDEIEMQEKCGIDPDKRQAWLRDHPHLHATTRSKSYFKAKKSFSFPSALRPRGGRK